MASRSCWLIWTSPPPDGAVLLSAAADLEAISRQMLVDGLWQDRPVAALILTAGAVPRVILATAPALTSVRIFDAVAGELLFEGLTGEGAFWNFPDTGHYAVEVEPTLPWLPTVLQFEVPE